jgi:hypothetical protein
VSTSMARHSRVKSSTTVSSRNHRPLANWSLTKSSDHRWLARSAGAGFSPRHRPSAFVCARSLASVPAGRCERRVCGCGVNRSFRL